MPAILFVGYGKGMVFKMTNLGCNVNSCVHNKEKCCCLNSIHVDGTSATKVDDTCCGSYVESSETSPKNSAASPKLSLSISCDATNCVHNMDKKCVADHIDISGLCASDACETVCATFKDR